MENTFEEVLGLCNSQLEEHLSLLMSFGDSSAPIFFDYLFLKRVHDSLTPSFIESMLDRYVVSGKTILDEAFGLTDYATDIFIENLLRKLPFVGIRNDSVKPLRIALLSVLSWIQLSDWNEPMGRRLIEDNLGPGINLWIRQQYVQGLVELPEAELPDGVEWSNVIPVSPFVLAKAVEILAR